MPRVEVAVRLMVFLSLALCAQGVAAQEPLPLWDGVPPYFVENELEEYVAESWGVPCVHNVNVPSLTVHRAAGESSGHAMVIFPGGGYVLESFVAEGQRIAEYLAAHGVTAAVVKYRLPLAEASAQPQLVPMADARRAVALMRSLAGDYGFDRGKVGVMGFSAGGHLAACVSVLPSAQANENPDFAALIYAPVTMSQDNRTWLEESLFHRAMSDDELRQLTLVDRVGPATPPSFLVHAFDDDVVPVSESEAFARALIAAGREAELHVFARGGHGFGVGHAEDGTGQWLDLLVNWIRRQ